MKRKVSSENEILPNEQYCLICDGCGIVNNRVCRSCNGHGKVLFYYDSHRDTHVKATYQPSQDCQRAIEILGMSERGEL